MARNGVKVTWDYSVERKFIKKLEDDINESMEICGVVLRDEVVKNISTPTRTHGPSLPGEFPHADSGTLKKSIFWNVANFVLTVGSTLKYAWFLEVGTSRMAPRPFLVPTFEKFRKKLRKIVETGRS